MTKDDFPDPREGDIVYGDRRISRPDVSLPDWEVPDTAYRPIPIVWFTGAFLIHLCVAGAILLIIPASLAVVTIGLAAFAALGIAKWTWARGMRAAGKGWQIATILMLLFNLLFVVAVALG